VNTFLESERFDAVGLADLLQRRKVDELDLLETAIE
jgi:hypothetical protein